MPWGEDRQKLGAVPDDFEIAEVYKEKRQQKVFSFLVSL
jgi:hypothetical protein